MRSLQNERTAKQCFDRNRTIRLIVRETHGTVPSAPRGTVSAPASPLLLRDGGGRSSGVYRCPGRQLGVLRFALRETVAFLRLSPPLASYRISRARLASLATTYAAWFLPKGSISTPFASISSLDPWNSNPAYIP